MRCEWVRGGHTIVLGDLVALRLVLVEVVLPVEAALGLDVASQRDSGAQCRDQCLALEVRLGTREGDVEEGGMGVGRVGGRGRGAGEQLASCVELGVDLDAHRQLPLLQQRICCLGLALVVVLVLLALLAPLLVLELLPKGHDVIVEACGAVEVASGGLERDWAGAGRLVEATQA